MKNFLIIILALSFLVFGAAVFFYYQEKNILNEINSFEDCLTHGFPVMESHPRQCMTPDGRSFTEVLEEPAPLERDDLIVLISPKAEEFITSPLEISGQARGNWFFEATFPVVLTNWDGLIIAEHYATANPPDGGDWMTEEFVPFKASLNFENPYKEGDPDFMRRGSLILQKSNPSGLPEFDDALEITVYFSDSGIEL